MRGLLTTLTATLLLGGLAARAFAGEAEDRAGEVLDALRAGRIPAAVERLRDEGVRALLTARPDLAHLLLDRAYRLETVADASEEQLRALATELGSLADAAHEAAPDDDRGRWALAHALVLRERAGFPAGPDGGEGRWCRAAGLLAACHERTPGKGEALGFAVSFLLEGICADEDGRHPRRKLAEKLTRLARREHGDEGALAASIGGAYLWTAESLVESDRKDAKWALKAGLEALRPHVGGDLPDRAAATLFNAGVTLDRTAGFALRERYVTATVEAAEGALLLEVPISSRWELGHTEETEELPASLYITRTDPAGGREVQILFRTYRWGMTYPFGGDRTVNGDNVKGLVRELGEMAATRIFAAGARVKGPTKHALSDDLSGHMFDVSGLLPGEGEAERKEGGALRLSGYAVRGHNQTTYVVLVYRYGVAAEADRKDPELDAVLAGVREPDR